MGRAPLSIFVMLLANRYERSARIVFISLLLKSLVASAGRTSRLSLMGSIASGYVTACCHLPRVEEIQKTGSISLPHQVTFLLVCTEPHPYRQHKPMQRQ